MLLNFGIEIRLLNFLWNVVNKEFFHGLEILCAFLSTKFVLLNPVGATMFLFISYYESFP
jgi:hypothetical protein